MNIFKLFNGFRKIPFGKETITTLLFLNLISTLTGCINLTSNNSIITDFKNQSTNKEIEINSGYFAEIPYIFKAKNDGFLISDGRYVNLYSLEGALSESWDLNKYFDFEGGSAIDVDVVKIDSLNVFIANHSRTLYLLYTKNQKMLKKETLDNGGFNIRVQNDFFYTSIQTYNDTIGDLVKGILSYRIVGLNCVYTGFVKGTDGMFVDFEIVNNNITFWYDDRKVHSCNINGSTSETFPFNVDERITGIKFIGLDSGVLFFRAYNDSINKDELFLCDNGFTLEKEKYVNVDYSKIEMNKNVFYYKDSGLIYSYRDNSIYVLLINGKASMTIYRISELLN